MRTSATQLAAKLLNRDPGELEELRVHEFADDDEAHDDEAVEKLYADFLADLDNAESELTKQYGEPSRSGEGDDHIIPLNGVLGFSIWNVGDKQLFVAVTHEDHGVPVLLMLGTIDTVVA